jgi:Subtilase family
MKKHLILRNNSETEKFTNPQAGGSKFVLPERDRNLHSQKLLLQISSIRENTEDIQHLLPFQNGYYAEIKGEPTFSLNLKSIEADGRELVSIKTVDNTEIATIFLDEAKLSKLEAKIQKYQTEDSVRLKKDGTESRKAKNKSVVESISKINLASILSLWTDETVFPNENEIIRWEAWLRAGENEEERNQIIEIFRNASHEAQLKISSKEIRFPETTVILVQATARQINQTLYPLNILSELRKAVDTADFFLGLGRDEEQDWVDDAVSRIEPPAEDAPAVCLLDTGVNYEHPLLKEAMNSDEMDAYNSDWLITDHHGHGTGMAGLSLHSDLVEMLASAQQIPLQHRIESVKILPPVGQNPTELYGEITKECVARAKIFAPNRNRVICLPVTSTQHRFRGIPSSWSAMIDEISSASNEDNKKSRLFFISAGNVAHNECVDYPNNNFTDEIDNPAQSFNAITVGAFTNKVIIDPNSPDFGNQPLAQQGGLCPYSKTSMTWKDEWANKPDIVMEGGNLVNHQNTPHQTPYQTPSLRLLTTNSDWQQRYLTDFGEPSASTALASRIGALILANYPNLRAETVRGLIIHSANWTPQMKSEYPNNNQTEKRNLLRCYGYGVPSLEKALYSANNSVTLIAEDSLQPFIKAAGKDAKANEMNLHEIPWAEQVLLELGELEVEMRVTLSYFIEPNPSGKGYKNKHRYASHQLKFTTIKPDENKDDFRKRVNKAAREDNETSTSIGSDSSGWIIGTKLRHKGSVHSDIWKGTAADLATKNVIAIYPVGGWWKELKRQEKWHLIANYSLIVSIKTQDTEVDIYTPIQNQIAIPIEI